MSGMNYSDYTDQELRDAAITLEADVALLRPIPALDPRLPVVISACQETLYYRSFGTSLVEVQIWLNDLKLFLRDTVLNAPEYSMIRPAVGMRLERIDLYLQGLEQAGQAP